MRIKHQILALALALPLLAFTAGNALANLAANTQIVNTAQLLSNGAVIATSSVTVQVSLVASSPNVTISPATGAYTGPDNQVLTDSVVVTATANGPASYTITPALDGSSNATSPSVAGGASVVLGASVTTGTSGTTFVTVPSFPYSVDSANNDANQINGIGVGDTLVLTVGGTVYSVSVTGVSNPGTTNGTATITFSGTTLSSAPPAGTPVYEKQTVNLNVKPGTVIATGTAITVDVKATVSTANASDVTVTTKNTTSPNPNAWTTPTPNVNVTKYVRNTGTSGNPASGGTPTTFTINGSSNTYYRTGVTGNTGDTLEYVLVAENTASSAASNLGNCALTDALPTTFVTLRSNAYGTNQDVWYIDQTGGAGSALQIGATNQASYTAPTLKVNVGTGADGTTGGTLEFGKTVIISYQVTIK